MRLQRHMQLVVCEGGDVDETEVGEVVVGLSAPIVFQLCFGGG